MTEDVSGLAPCFLSNLFPRFSVVAVVTAGSAGSPTEVSLVSEGLVSFSSAGSLALEVVGWSVDVVDSPEVVASTRRGRDLLAAVEEVAGRLGFFLRGFF